MYWEKRKEGGRKGLMVVERLKSIASLFFNSFFFCSSLSSHLATRSGAAAASLVATMPPMEWPTTWTGWCQPTWSCRGEKGGK